MQEEKCGLIWQTYSDHLKTLMKGLLIDNDFVDVTLVTQDKKHMKAHKNILSASSTVFKDIFQQEKCLDTVVYLRGIKFSELESIIQFIYLGEANICKGKMKEFLSVAKSFEIEELYNVEAEELLEDHRDTNDLSIDTVQNEHQPAQVMTHERSPVLEDSRIKCEHCDIKLVDRHSLQRHIQSKHEEIRYSCDQCDQKFSRPNYLHVHIRAIHEGLSVAKSFEIEELYNVEAEELLEDHSDTNDLSIDTVQNEVQPTQAVTYERSPVLEDSRLKCENCYMNFVDRQTLQRHIRSKHEGIRYSCDQCDQKFSRPIYLKVHIRAIHEGLKFSCNQCNYQSSTQPHLRKHIEAKHKGIKYSCHHCDYKASRPHNLKAHIESVHEGVRYACDHCEYEASQKGNLKTHMKVKHIEYDV